MIKNKILSPFDLKLLFIYLLITLIQDTKVDLKLLLLLRLVLCLFHKLDESILACNQLYTVYGDQILLNQIKSELLTEEKTFYDIFDVITGLFRIEGFKEKLQNHVQICWITLLEVLD